MEHRNGTGILLDDIDAELSKRISSRDKLLLRSMRYILEEIPDTRRNIQTMKGDIVELQKNSIVIQAKRNPKTAVFVFLAVFIFNSMVNWAGIRKPILQGIIYSVSGILVPLDVLP